ncbi:PREDICTED: nucleolar protein 4-like [Amphimedon queenslandica]|uniref:Nucleolar protein 4 helical domain-containing protein n=1 Tax=Amphimedon queenslandica TaxID=400682 RepID=A0A1X7UVT8_AMPQE|nr:PREDICTED: nucleolar protein 4-like [Amphimedon queenslandica]|eukprot:XP_011404028.1 PREDICTED: nucleolar protein 4-like [Amphimedon queenslandica]
MATEDHQLQFGTSYDQDDREVESLTTPPPPAGISPGITVITAPPEIQETSLPKANPYAYLDVVKGSPSPGLGDPSDEDDSDHGGTSSDIYTQHMKGRVSPSPYTANTERARQFNTYVRSLIEERLDTLIPISHQPRDLIHQIIMDTNSRFPEFSSSVRKRIRTYLKSYRRSKRVKDMQAAAAIGHQYNSNASASGNGNTNTPSLSNGMITAKVNTTKTTTGAKEDSPLINIASISLPAELLNHKQNSSSPTSAIISINSLGGALLGGGVDKDGPLAKKPKLAPVAPVPVSSIAPPVTKSVTSPAVNNSNAVGGAKPVIPAAKVPTTNDDLSTNEVSTLKQLIQGYRESAGFLNRAADQLEEMLLKEHPDAAGL